MTYDITFLNSRGKVVWPYPLLPHAMTVQSVCKAKLRASHAAIAMVVAIAAGWYHGLALKRDGTVVAWGENAYGQSTIPGGLNGVVAIAAGGFYSLALKRDGTVIAWGLNNMGQTNVPGGLADVMAITAGGNRPAS